MELIATLEECRALHQERCKAVGNAPIGQKHCVYAAALEKAIALLVKRKQKALAEAEKDAAFEEFWAAYPHKTAKERARTSFRVQGCALVLKSVMSGLARDKGSVNWTKDGGQFIPHPSTWLNQRRWESSLEVPTKAESYFTSKNPLTGQPIRMV